ncbi:hypothetical protein LAUMK41_04626 [Mycobacterium attenuatum]|uniref:Uncharacterized protein n=1 Tax=Mycobacterium attenuatum TaxID=2341086 RepID=A0A498Q9R3_9MYCO|nr:hypothetical protein LAUMK136_04500 [Mycobacterium attenuatum]VBA61250.1 hypothetical protein LAUMK41_04626 [Mycobacterium attenuatum]
MRAELISGGETEKFIAATFHEWPEHLGHLSITACDNPAVTGIQPVAVKRISRSAYGDRGRNFAFSPKMDSDKYVFLDSPIM